MRRMMAAIAAMAVFGLAAPLRAWAEEPGKPVTDRQVAVMMFIDYGRSFGYQTLVASIQIEVVKADIGRDQALLAQKEELYRKKAIPLIELEVARLKDFWNRKQLVVAQKNHATVAAQYEAMREMARHFGGVEVPADRLYAMFQRAWDAGCEKGPDEVEAMKAWAAFAAKSVERARQLQRRGAVSVASVLEKEAQLKIAEANYQQREARLNLCKSVLFPNLDEILAVGR